MLFAGTSCRRETPAADAPEVDLDCGGQSGDAAALDLGAMDLVDQMIAVLISYNRTANEGLGDVDLELDAELLTQLLDVMEANARNARRPAPEDRDEEAWPLD